MTETADDIPPGYERVWAPEPDAGWEVLPEPDKSHGCRWSNQGVRCRRPSVVRLNRSSRGRPTWWHYCDEHLFGRRIRDGALECLILQACDEREEADRG